MPLSSSQLAEITEYEKGLAVGQVVRIRWTHSGGFYVAMATLSKINKKSVRARLNHHVQGPSGGWPEGHELVIPLFWALNEWSANNRVDHTAAAELHALKRCRDAGIEVAAPIVLSWIRAVTPESILHSSHAEIREVCGTF